MLDIGKQIKQLREERQLTGKDLAQQIGLSQSQMSRLEAGQRRIDTEILAKIALALEVSPAQFFPDSVPSDESAEVGFGSSGEVSPKRQRELEISQLHVELGKLIRSERRRRHLTVDDLARKTGHTRAYVIAVEEGRRNGLQDGFLKKAAKLLAIDPFTLLEQDERIIRDLKSRVNCLDQALSAAGPLPHDDEGPATPKGTPILVGDESVYPVEFDETGLPSAAVEGFLTLPDLAGRPSFALRVVGLEMEAADGTGFSDGDLVVFATDRQARTGEYSFVRFGENLTAFRQIFHDDGGLIRLQPRRHDTPPAIFDLAALESAWPLVAHIALPVSRD